MRNILGDTTRAHGAKCDVWLRFVTRVITLSALAVAALASGGSRAAAQPAGRGCSAFKPCGNGYSCQPFVQKCYNSPRLEGQPCSAGFGCGPGLRCVAGVQKCVSESAPATGLIEKTAVGVAQAGTQAAATVASAAAVARERERGRQAALAQAEADERARLATLAAERALADREAAERASAERIAAERASAERMALERARMERAAAERARLDREREEAAAEMRRRAAIEAEARADAEYHARLNSEKPWWRARAEREEAARVRGVPRAMSRLQSFNWPERFILYRDGQVFLGPSAVDADRSDADFEMVPGLGDSRAVSFRSISRPDLYLRHQRQQLVLERFGQDPSFALDATFRIERGLGGGGISLEAVSMPGYFLRHLDYRLMIAPGDGTEEFMQDATFSLHAVSTQGRTRR